MREVLTFILAGGKGERLNPLTRDRAKPAVPFGGMPLLGFWQGKDEVAKGSVRSFAVIE